jgi:hypothetical protein
MDISQLWTAIQEIQKSTATMNSELGRTVIDVAWLKQSFWELMSWIRIIGCGIIVGIGLNVWNLLAVKKNGKTVR